jgi:penicillin-binding protein 1A
MGLSTVNQENDEGCVFIQVAYATLDALRSSDLELSGRMSGQWQGQSLVPELATIKLELAEVGCDAALNALPSALRPMLAGLELRGSMHSRLELMLSRSDQADTVLQVSPGIEGCSVVREPPSADTKALRADYEHRSPDGRPHILKEGAPGFTPIKQMPDYLPRAFVAAEDAQFFKHKGFDPHQIERSLAIDVQQGRFARGGSTISQQLVKNLFLHRKRTLARKLQEAALTWRLESNLQKDRILEIYLNIIEFGDGHTYGITDAAERWFAVEPGELTILQTAFLAAIVPEPTSMSARIRDAQGLDPVSAGRVATILRAMKRGKVISKSQYQKARRQTLHFANGAVALRTAPSAAN